MDYKLIVTTHGKGETLERTLASYARHVTPPPADWVLIEDGAEYPLADAELWKGRRVGLAAGETGFCAAVAEGWSEAAATEHEWVLWLEHDFLFTRPVDLTALARVLRKMPKLAQMSLLRQPISRDEILRGSVIAHANAQRCSDFLTGWKWCEHDAYWTTNPSLFRSQLARDVPWPEGPECEGKMGLELRSRGFSFGVWGSGEQWVEHIGKRTGRGY